ncbi:MAG: nicotinate (nicotinamide) nucleotide adenylyltransferase [Oscillospiraceae bacterium]|nr:nicotinate (nicotinamide) nucleotide adenylyltransferase [Oscillospiraceae bacterium]
MRIAIFGGTFNPIHNGHLNVIENVQKTLNPDKLILMPTHIPPHKAVKDLASDEARLEMCRLVAQMYHGVEVSDFELKSEGKSYTVTTMENLHSTYPDDELYFVMGSDMFHTFLTWVKPHRIMELCTLVCVCRSDDDRKRAESDAVEIRLAGGNCILIDCEAVEASSTEIRADVIAYNSTFGQVPENVERYILEKSLYNFDKTKYNSYREYLAGILSEKRFNHSLNVADEALKLAVLYDCDREKAYFAGLVHDICKEIPTSEQYALTLRSPLDVTDVELNAPKTYHGIAGSVFLEEHFGITDPDILSAVRYHTVAKGGMNLLEKIIYMADLISKERHYPDVEYYRDVTHKDLNLGLYEAMKFSIEDSISKTRTIPTLTLDAYNEYTLYKLSLKGKTEK